MLHLIGRATLGRKDFHRENVKPSWKVQGKMAYVVLDRG